jgi:hypothetical protein
MPRGIQLPLTRDQLDLVLETAGIDTENLRLDQQHKVAGVLVLSMAITVNSIADLARFFVELTAMLAETTIHDEEPDVDGATEPVRQLARRTVINQRRAGQLLVVWPGVTLSDQQ